MKALLCREFGPLEGLAPEEVSSTIVGNGQVVVAVKAAGVNFTDTLIVEGKYPTALSGYAERWIRSGTVDAPEAICGVHSPRPRLRGDLPAGGRSCTGGEYAGNVCNVCADICEECARHPQAHCQNCAQACHRCTEECRRMSSALRQNHDARAGPTCH